MPDRAWNLSRDELAPLAASWLDRGATAFGVWQGERPLACWPSTPTPTPPELTAALDTSSAFALGVSGLNGSAHAAQLAVDARLVSQLAFKEHETEALTAELASCQDLLLAIYGLARSFRSTIDLDVTLQVIAREAMRLLRGVVGLIVIETGDLPPIVVIEPAGASIDLAAARDTLHRVTIGGKASVVADAAAGLGVPHHAQALIAPIPIDGRTGGALAVVGRSGAFQAPDLKLAHAIAEQASVQIENALLHRRRVEQVRLENEMQVAARVQSELLPRGWPAVNGLDLAATTRPASHVCGDFYDVVPVPGQLVATLGDVSGKGVPAALVMTMTRTFLRSAIRAAAPGDLDRILSLAAVSASEELGGLEMFSTAVVASFDPVTTRVRYVNAGHAPVIHKPRDGAARLLVADGPPLGMLSHAVGHAHEVALGDGDVFIVATDGLNEASNHAGELFGYERLLAIVDEASGGDADAIADRLLASVEAFQDGRPRDDDQTVLVMKGTAHSEAPPPDTGAPERLAFDLPADLRYLRLIGASVQELIGPDEAHHVLRHEIEMALHEVCVNIVVHAYDGIADGRLDIVLSKRGAELIAQISDRGKPFDPAALKPPDLEGGQIHGYGMFMAHELVDEVSYTRREGVNHWRLTKRWT